MSKHKKSSKLFEPTLVREALKQSFVKLNPRILIHNPVMFTVEIGAAIMLIVCIWIWKGEKSQGSFLYNLLIFLILFITVLSRCFLQILQKPLQKQEVKLKLIVCAKPVKTLLLKKYLAWEKYLPMKSK